MPNPAAREAKTGNRIKATGGSSLFVTRQKTSNRTMTKPIAANNIILPPLQPFHGRYQHNLNDRTRFFNGTFGFRVHISAKFSDKQLTGGHLTYPSLVYFIWRSPV
jgi:hypothetical protein